jgi:hypothetical protein
MRVEDRGSQYPFLFEIKHLILTLLIIRVDEMMGTNDFKINLLKMHDKFLKGVFISISHVASFHLFFLFKINYYNRLHLLISLYRLTKYITK